MTQDQEDREHQQMKEFWYLWQMLLKKIVVQHVKNFVELRDRKLRRKMHKNRPQLLVAGQLILHDNARPHIADVVTKKLRHYECKLLPQALYSPDMSPPVFVLLPEFKEPMRELLFSSLQQ